MLAMILHLLEEKSAESVQSFLMIRVTIVMVCWLFVVFGVLVDFWSGTSTAKAIGEPLQSKGFRRTVAKAGEYIRVLLFALMFDALGICFVHPYALPFATMAGTIAVLIIEAKSVIENARRKKSHAAEIPEVVRDIIHAVTAKQAAQILTDLTAISSTTTVKESVKIKEEEEAKNG